MPVFPGRTLLQKYLPGMIENEDVDSAMTEVILMDFQATGGANLPIIFVHYWKALSWRLRRNFFIARSDEIGQRDPLLKRQLFCARRQWNRNFFRNAFPVVNLTGE